MVSGASSRVEFFYDASTPFLALADHEVREFIEFVWGEGFLTPIAGIVLAKINNSDANEHSNQNQKRH